MGVPGPSQAVDRASKAPGQKRTSDVRLALNSRRKWTWRWRSVFDPQETFGLDGLRHEPVIEFALPLA
jgi:hypothetical protein